MRLAVGTVQFGLTYGVANTVGQVDTRAVATILSKARQAGIDTLDTAIAYGDSETRLGQAGVEGWQVVSKLPEMPADVEPAAWVNAQLEGSLQRLRLHRLKGLLLHRPMQLLESRGDKLWAALGEVKARGLVGAVGISVYGPEELDALADRFPPDLVQAPYNILDRRLTTSGWLERLIRRGVEVHARSVFMQGLLLMPPAGRPRRFERWATLWAAWRDWLGETRLSPLEACLAFALAEARIARIVVGVDSPAQFEEILAAARIRLQLPPPDHLSSTDPDLVNPSRWDSP